MIGNEMLKFQNFETSTSQKLSHALNNITNHNHGWIIKDLPVDSNVDVNVVLLENGHMLHSLDNNVTSWAKPEIKI